MNYSETLEYLFAQLPMFTRIGSAAIKKDLTNTIALCDVLGHPEKKLKCIHVAGTNGKGSTSHMLASILQEAGYKTGLYTSPHLNDFRERIRINGRMISEAVVIEFVERYKHEFENIAPSFFEWTVALAFNQFALENTDVAVVETGLGGRLDSTNVITPVLSVITNIGWDHMDLLGDTLEKIAFEKAGIIKPNIPVVIGETQNESQTVFIKKAIEHHAPIFFADQIIQFSSIEFTQDGVTAHFKSEQGYTGKLKCDLGGYYQEQNLKTVLQSIEVLRLSGFHISYDHIVKGLLKVKANTGLLGRWQKLGEKPLIVADTGHNVNGLTYVMRQIASQPKKQLHMVIGMVRDKDVSKVLQMLPTDATYYFCNADLPRALPANELKEKAMMFGLNGDSYPTVKAAFRAAQLAADKEDMLFIGGSTFVVGELLKHFSE